MKTTLFLICFGCWFLSGISILYALGNDSGHSSFDFSILAIGAFLLIISGTVGVLKGIALSKHLIISAIVLCAFTLFIRYSNMIVPYELWVHQMELAYSHPISPHLYFICVGLCGVVGHVWLILLNQKTRTPAS